MKQTLATLFSIAKDRKAHLSIKQVLKGHEGHMCVVSAKKIEEVFDIVDIKISMLGGEGGGKSTLVLILSPYLPSIAWSSEERIEG